MRTNRWKWLVLLSVLLGVGIYLVYIQRAPNQVDDTISSIPMPPDPRLTYQGPFQNVHPDVQAVGDARCADCHGMIAHQYSHHPMGRSMFAITDVLDTLDLSEKTNNPFKTVGSQFSVERQAQQLLQKEVRRDAQGNTLYERATEVHFSLGSGNHGCSYFTLKDGYLFQTAISWYSQKGIWDLSPGFGPSLLAGRPVVADCVYCHVNHAYPVEGTINRYEKPYFSGHTIGCERCHGPGEKHVAKHEKTMDATGGIDYTIVNPKHLEPALREAICQQCHLGGEARILKRGRKLFEFRPGLPIDAFWAIFVEDHQGENRKATNHVEQMYLSKCFQASQGQMGCVTCHDPHEKLAADKRIDYFRDRCLQCHKDCSIPKVERLTTSQEDSCIVCHMPKFDSIDIAHTAATNHLILRRGQKDLAGKQAYPPMRPWLLFPQKQVDLEDPIQVRDLTLAYALNLIEGKPLQPNTTVVAQQATRLFPQEADVWRARGKILAHQNRHKEAIPFLEEALKWEPNHEEAITTLAQLYQNQNRIEEARTLWQKAVQINPQITSYQVRLATTLVNQKDPDSWQIIEEALKRDPGDISLRQLHLQALMQRRLDQQAEKAFQLLEKLNPPNLNEIRLQYMRYQR